MPLSRLRLTLAFLIAAVSDILSLLFSWAPPVEWAIDAVTAALLFVLLGFRWELLLPILPEAIPGVAMFPFWLMDVAFIAYRNRCPQ